MKPSKLDTIQTTCDNCGYAPALSDNCKERIKALMLKLVSESYIEDGDTDDGRYERFSPLKLRNLIKAL